MHNRRLDPGLERQNVMLPLVQANILFNLHLLPHMIQKIGPGSHAQELTQFLLLGIKTKEIIKDTPRS